MKSILKLIKIRLWHSQPQAHHRELCLEVSILVSVMWGLQMSEVWLDQAVKSLWSSSGLDLVFKSNTSFGCICHKFLKAYFVQGPLLSPGEYKALVFKLLEQDFNKTSSFKSQPTFLDEEFNNWTVVIANRISLYKIVEESKPVCLHYRSKVYERFISGYGCCRDWNTTFFTNGNGLTRHLYKIWKRNHFHLGKTLWSLCI